MTLRNSALMSSASSWLALTILVLLPFHAFFTTWLGSNFGHLDLWKIWKELAITGLFLPFIYLACRDQKFYVWLKKSWLPKLFIIYILLNLFLGVLAVINGRISNNSALIYGLMANLRFISFFIITVWLVSYNNILTKYWWKILLIPGAIVIGFGLLQLFLPHDFLSYFGYGPNTIPAYQTVDQKLAYQRIQSTLRGANPLGAYLLVVIIAFVLVPISSRLKKTLALAAGSAAMFFTYSRSAWFGLILSGLSLIVLKWHRKVNKYRRQIIIIIPAFLALSVLSLAILRNNNKFQTIFFHTDETSISPESSNTSRFQKIKIASQEILQNPLGEGPGTAGPASFRNGRPRVAENYFLQAGQETGWLGLGIFIAINVCLIRFFWSIRQDNKALVLLSCFIGLTLVNLLSHAWADDTLGLLFWGLSGIVYGDAILNKKRKGYVKAEKILP